MSNAITDYGAEQWGYSGVKGLMPVSRVLIKGRSGPTTFAECESPNEIVMLAGGYQAYVEKFYGTGPGTVNNETDFFINDFGGVYDQYIPRAIHLSLPGDPFYESWRTFKGGSNFAFAEGGTRFLSPEQVDEPRRWLVSVPK